MIGKLLERLLGVRGAGSSDSTEMAGREELYQGYRIEAVPRRDAGGWRVAGRISRDRGGEWETVSFVRADVQADAEDAMATSLLKARRLIDERGEALFNGD